VTAHIQACAPGGRRLIGEETGYSRTRLRKGSGLAPDGRENKTNQAEKEREWVTRTEGQKELNVCKEGYRPPVSSLVISASPSHVNAMFVCKIDDLE
jgi:hypothetical protein